MKQIKWITLTILALLLLATFAIPAAAQDVTQEPADDIAETVVDVTVQTAESTAGVLEGFFERLTTPPDSAVMRILMVVGGVILLVAGWRIYDFIILIAGFLIGASVASSMIVTDNELLMVALPLIGGLIGAALSVFVYNAAVFVIGAYVGVIVTSALASALSLAPVSPLVLLIGGLIGGLIFIGLSFELLVLLSALAGAQLLATGLGLGLVWVIVFAVIGVVLQLGLIRVSNYEFRRRPARVYRFRRSTYGGV